MVFLQYALVQCDTWCFYISPAVTRYFYTTGNAVIQLWPGVFTILTCLSPAVMWCFYWCALVQLWHGVFTLPVCIVQLWHGVFTLLVCIVQLWRVFTLPVCSPAVTWCFYTTGMHSPAVTWCFYWCALVQLWHGVFTLPVCIVQL